MNANNYLPAPIVSKRVIDGVIVQKMGESGTEFFSIAGKTFYQWMPQQKTNRIRLFCDKLSTAHFTISQSIVSLIMTTMMFILGLISSVETPYLLAEYVN